MTNAPVKDVGSLMNYVGSSRVVTKSGMDQTSNFGDVMNRASGNSADQVKETQNAQEQTAKTDSSLEHSKVMKKDSSVVKAKKPKAAESTKTEEEAVKEEPKQDEKKINLEDFYLETINGETK